VDTLLLNPPYMYGFLRYLMALILVRCCWSI